ncbi:unnamed protein product [Lactuca saligna]|uniref:Replication factor A C-terminal domain-containing protein n=1 Tax=Lactuca saligna TaxID=75948 RepID=A0AA35YER0_LACSI|nr:unnamed protein product [Lactuca saligna]
MSEIFTAISELGYASPGTALQVRILRTWTPQVRGHETWFLAVDKYGDAIQILGQRKDQGFVQSALAISKCYTLTKYGCGEPDTYQKWLHNPVYIAVGTASCITSIPDTVTIPTHWFNFIPKSQIPAYINQYPDFLGVFVKLVACIKKNDEPYLLLILRNEFGEDIAISLWKECTDAPSKFNRNAIQNAPAPTVIAVTNVRIMDYGGSLRLGTSSATHIYVNPPIKETDTLLDSYKINVASIPLFGLPVPLTEINEKKHSDLLEKTFTAEASIIEYVFSDYWYQVFCPQCKISTLKQGKDWFCPSHGTITSPTPMYKLMATITDPTSSMTVTLSDNAGQKIFGTTADKLILEGDPNHRKKLPNIIKETEGITKKMKLRITNTSTERNIRFIITDIEDNSSQSSSITTPPSENTSSSNVPHKTPTCSSAQNQPKVKRALNFENTGMDKSDAGPKRARRSQ